MIYGINMKKMCAMRSRYILEKLSLRGNRPKYYAAALVLAAGSSGCTMDARRLLMMFSASRTCNKIHAMRQTIYNA